MKKQLVTLTIISFISNLYQLLFNILRYHVKTIKDQYDNNKEYKSYYWLFYFYLLTNLSITISNYLTFFFLVNDQFKTNKDENSNINNRTDDDLNIKFKDESLKDDINQILLIDNKNSQSNSHFTNKENLYDVE
jgi:hypothetical protein